MIHGQNLKKTVALGPQSVTAGATVSGNIDTLGYGQVNLDIALGSVDAVSNKPTVVKLGEADVTEATSFSDIATFVGGGEGGFTIENGVTTGAQIYNLNVNTAGRKRYLKLSFTPATTQVVSAVANLSRAQQAPVGATAQGVTVLVNG